MRNALLCVVALIGCSRTATTPALDARVHALEVEVADLRAAAKARDVAERQSTSTDGVRRATDAMMRAASANCKDVSIPSGTLINLPVQFDVGKTSAPGGNRITITEVLGSRGDFAVGGVYLVRGEYTLASADEATLGFSVGAIDPGDACTFGNTRGRQHVARGTGKFELATTIVHRGYPGVSFFIEGIDGSGGRLFGAGSGSVQFGKGDFLQR